jgi:hypothetical protein
MMETEGLQNVVLLFQTDVASHPRGFYCIQSPQKFQDINIINAYIIH